MSEYQYLFTVIVPTFDRRDEIKELLESLSTQTISIR
jgi:glycosyltransferase involved in cell wall biosynthesis